MPKVRKTGEEMLEDVMAKAHHQGKSVVLSAGLKNERAYRLYERLGFLTRAGILHPRHALFSL